MVYFVRDCSRAVVAKCFFSILGFCVSFCVINAAFVCDARAQLGQEFASSAPEGWSDYRASIFNKLAIEVQKTTRDDQAFRGSDVVEIKTTSKKFVGDGFRYCEVFSKALDGGKFHAVTVINPYYGFSVGEAANGTWQLNSLDENASEFSFGPAETDLKLRNALPRGLTKDLSGVFSHEPRLEVGVAKTMEEFYSEHSGWFEAFAEREDENLGRIVTATIAGQLTETDLSEEMKSRLQRSGVDTDLITQVNGEIEFLADYFWIPTSMNLTYETFNKEKEWLRSSTSFMESTYDNKSASPFVPSRVVSGVRRLPTNNNNLEREYLIRELTNEEVKSIKEMCYLSDYNLPEPKGIRSFGIWWWVAGIGALAIVASFLIAKLSRR